MLFFPASFIHAVFSLFFCRAFRKAWCNTTPDGLAKPGTSEPRMDSGDYQKGCEVHLEAEEMQEEGLSAALWHLKSLFQLARTIQFNQYCLQT